MLKSLYQHVPKEIITKIDNLNLNVKSEDLNNEINLLLQRTVLWGGKRLRPLLTFLMGRLYGLTVDEVSPLGIAIEEIHAASLAHDDVVDSATMRRGRPSINAASSNKRAVLAGDYLLADVIVELSKLGNLKLVQETADVIFGLAEGEWLQLDVSKTRDYSRLLIEEIAVKKTGSVMSWCCSAPAILSNQSVEVIELSRELGLNLGIAFQLIDDTLDFSNHSGKEHLPDLENGIVNAVVFEWLNLRPQKLESYKSGVDLLEVFDGDEQERAVKIVKRDATYRIDRASELLEEIASRLDVEASLLTPIKMILKFLGEREV